MSAITFKSVLSRATTTADGGWRIYLDLSEKDSETVAALVKNKDRILAVAIVPEDPISGDEFEEEDFG